MTCDPRRHLGLAAAATAVLASTAHAQHDDGDEIRARLLGALVSTRLTGSFDEAPARAVLDAIARAVDVPITGRYDTDRVGHGLEPDVEISFAFEDADALSVIELVLEQCELYEPCTWQLRRGFVEVGTKERLSAPAAADRRMYPIGDLLIEPPHHATSGGGLASVEAFEQHPYRPAALTIPVPLEHDVSVVGNRGEAYVARKDPEELAPEIVRGIVQTVEPGNWDYGQLDDDEQEPSAAGARRRTRPRRIATLRRWNDRLIITAPDYIHRQVNGYPPLVAPPPINDEERVARGTSDAEAGIELSVASTGPRTAEFRR